MCAHGWRTPDRIVHDARHAQRREAAPRRPRGLYRCSVVDPDVVDRIASASAEELAAALGIPRGRAVDRALALASLPLARALARFDDITRQRGVASAAADLLGRRGVSLRIQGDPPAGPGLVLVNHPGAWDAIALMAACGRREVSMVANERAFLRALPSLERLLLFVPERGGALERARATREVVRRIRGGGLVVHFGAGCIEVDPAFDSLDEPSWARGSGHLARAALAAGGAVTPALVWGVHAARAKHMRLVRALEARGLGMIAPLAQVALPRALPVRATVAFGEALGARDIEELVAAHDDESLTRALAARSYALFASRPA